MQTSAKFFSSCKARTRFCSGQSGTTTAQLQSITQKRSRFTRCHKATGSCGRVVRARQWMCLRRQERQGVDSPKQDDFAGAAAKKKHTHTLGGVCFFALAPCRRPTERLLPLPSAAAKKHTPWVVFFFVLLWPRAGAQRRFSFPCLSPGPEQKKKHTLGFCSGPVPAPNGASPSPAFPRGRSKKKNTLGGVFFLLWPRAGAQGRSKKKPPCVVFFFALAPCRRPTKLLLPLPFPGAGAKKIHPGWCFFFFSGPVPAPMAGTKKKPGWYFFFALAPCRRPTGLLLPLPFTGAGAKKNTLGGVFVCSGPAERSRRPMERNKTKHFAHPGQQQKFFLETHDAGHEQKGATTKKKHPGQIYRV